MLYTLCKLCCPANLPYSRSRQNGKIMRPFASCLASYVLCRIGWEVKSLPIPMPCRATNFVFKNKNIDIKKITCSNCITFTFILLFTSSNSQYLGTRYQQQIQNEIVLRVSSLTWKIVPNFFNAVARNFSTSFETELSLRT